jgi:Ras GTPase-activating protein 3
MNFSHFSCNERDQNAKGCKAIDETPLEIDLVTQLDPARDLQRLHMLIVGEYARNFS